MKGSVRAGQVSMGTIDERGRASKVLITVVLIGLGLGGAVYFSCTHSELGELRAQLRSRGFKLTVRDLEAGERGAATNLTQFIQADQDLQRTRFGKLAGELRLMTPDLLGRPVPAVRRAKPFGLVADTNVAACSWEDFAAAAQRAGPELQCIRELVHQSIPRYSRQARTPVFSLINEARWLAADTVSALHEGARARALEDLDSLTGLALIGEQQKEHIAQIGRYAVMSIELKATWEALQSLAWEEADLRRMETDWKNLFPLRAAEAAAESELAQADEMGSEIQKEVAATPWPNRFWAYVGALDKGQDAVLLLKWPLAHFDAAEALEKGGNWNLIRTGLNELKSGIYAKKRSIHRHLGLRLLLSKLDGTFETSAGLEAGRQLLLTDIAIRRYKLRHEKLPPKTLRELTPELLDAASGQDIFGTGDLNYRANPDGTYLLYSVGQDGVDNGGDASPDPVDSNLWNSRDIVWSCP